MTCKECLHYDNTNTYADTGYCYLWEVHVKEETSCDEWEEE